MKQLNSVDSFGGIDADADQLLDDCFQDHEAYQRAWDHDRFIVIGRKGSGKTAIYRKILKHEGYDHFAFGHTFEDYPWHHHDLQATLGVPEEARYTQSWKYLILLSASKVLLNVDQTQPWHIDAHDDMQRLERFVTDSYGSRDPEVTQLFAPGKTLRVNPTLAIPGVGVGLNLEQVPIDKLPSIVQEVNRTVAESVFNLLNPDLSYHICFDQLDLGFTTDDPKYAQRLTGLLLAARDITLKARGADKKMSVDVFLRDDIYQLLRFEDKNKVSENLVSRIEWDSPRTQWTLKNLMEKRLAVLLEIPTQDSWDVVFDEDQEMRGRQAKYNHILDRTFRRPRDIIKFCNEVLQAYKARGPQSGERFQNEDVIAARQPYSEYLLNELDDEVFKHFSEYEAFLETIKSIGTLKFTREQFVAACEERTDTPPDPDPITALAKLFEFSIVGYLKAGGGGGGSTYVWRYLDPRARFDRNAPSFRVHSGFKEVLGLKEGGVAEAV